MLRLATVVAGAEMASGKPPLQLMGHLAAELAQGLAQAKETLVILQKVAERVVREHGS